MFFCVKRKRPPEYGGRSVSGAAQHGLDAEPCLPPVWFEDRVWSNILVNYA